MAYCQETGSLQRPEIFQQVAQLRFAQIPRSAPLLLVVIISDGLAEGEGIAAVQVRGGAPTLKQGWNPVRDASAQPGIHLLPRGESGVRMTNHTARLAFEHCFAPLA